MTQRYLNLNSQAWQNMCRAWRPPLSLRLLWQRYAVGPVNSSLGRMQIAASPRVPEELGVCSGKALIVLGYWRSGTTLLHELLAAGGNWSYPTTYACMNPHSFLLRTPGQRCAKRPMDNMEVRSESPQEDEFALLALGARSPYESFLFPKCLPDALRLADLNLLSEAEQTYWKRSFSAFVHTVCASQGNKPILLKSPPHSCRIATLRSLLPECRFVVIVREPLAVFESVVGMWHAMFKLYAMTTIPPEDDIRLAVLKNRPWFEQKLQDGLNTLPQGDYTFVSFEALVADPSTTIARLYEDLNLGPSSDATKKVGDNMVCRRSYLSTSRPTTLKWQSRIVEEWADIFRRYDYDTNLTNF